MTTKSGRFASVKKGTFTIAELGSYTLRRTQAEIDTSSFGSVWGKTDVGMQKWALSLEGFFDPTDTNGQRALEEAMTAGTLMTDIKVFVDNTSYYESTGSEGGARVTGFDLTHDKANVATVSFSLSGSGEITFV